VTTPIASASAKSLINAAWGFPEWWKAYPSGPRKVAKQQCLDRWARFDCASSATLILQHTEWLKTQPDWTKDGGTFVCAPLVYLNQRRWLDWTPPAPKQDATKATQQMLDNQFKGTTPPNEATRAKLAELRKPKERI